MCNLVQVTHAFEFTVVSKFKLALLPLKEISIPAKNRKNTV